MSRSVILTGGASGIGAAIARAFAAQGDHVVSLDRSAAPDANVSVLGDVRSPDSHAEAVAAAVAATGGVDVLVANAGIHDGGAKFDLSPSDLIDVMRAVFDVDVIGYVLALQACAPHLRERSGCAVLTLSDSAFLAGHTGAGIAYTAAKYAGLGVVKWAARALAPQVRVNAVAPGGVPTGLQAVSADGAQRAVFADVEAKRAAIAGRNALGTVLDPDEVAQLYVFLASPAARGMTAEILRPDGGLSVS